jgi:acyl-CoA hydrolase
VPMSTKTSAQPLGPADPPTDKELVLKVIPMPADTNGNGDIFGGWVMSHVDLAGSVIPARHVNGRMATVAVNEFIFKQPVQGGRHLLVLCGRHAHRPHLHHGPGRGLCRALPCPGPASSR